MTMPTTSIDLVLVSPLADLPTGDDVWLRMEQILETDLANTGEIAQVVDELYQVDPCAQPVEAEAAKDTFNTLPAGASITDLLDIAARKFDLAECNRRKNGDYTARVKIIRSHLLPVEENRYTLVPSVGEVSGISPTSERITITLAVKEQTSLVLDYPVRHVGDEKWPGTVRWLGSVWTADRGAIEPPVVRCSGRVLSWSTPCTGTLLVRVDTTYDIATVFIPGKPGAAPGTAEAVRECTLRAFYRYQVYETEIAAPLSDPTANQDDLAKICGWSDVSSGSGGVGSSGSSESSDDAAPADDDDDGPPLGCLEPDAELADPAYYQEKCCRKPPFALPDCALHASDRGMTEPPQAEKDRQEADHRGRISYVAVGPGPDGCGRRLRHQQVRPRNCCLSLAVELTWDHIRSASIISRGSAMQVFAYGGARPIIAIRVVGQGFWLDPYYTRRYRAISTNLHEIPITVYADHTACGYGQLDISDGCTTISWYYQCTAGEWVAIDPFDCELRQVPAQWAETPVMVAYTGPYAYFWYQDSRYKIRQRYWRESESTSIIRSSGTSYDEACAAAGNVDWESLIPEAKLNRYETWESWPHLIDIDNAMHRVTVRNYYWHGYYFADDYFVENELLFRPDAFGGEHVKIWSASYPQYNCLAAVAGVLSTGYWGTGAIAPTPDAANAQVWEWQC